MGIGRLAARGLIGGLFIGHGTQKLFGWFDGPGIAGTTPMMESLGMRPGRQNAYAAGLSEAVGGRCSRSAPRLRSPRPCSPGP